MSHPLLARLASADAEERRRACVDAVDDPSGVLLVDALAAALGDPALPVSRAAGDALVALGRHHDSVHAALRGAVRGDDPGRRLAAALAAARLEPPEPGLLPALVPGLGRSDADRCWETARVMVEIGRRHPEVLPLLLELIRDDPSARVRRMAAHCLRKLAPHDARVAEALLAASRDADASTRRAAYTGLAGLQPAPPEVIARLSEAAAGETDAAGRQLAAAALAQLGA